MDAVNEIATYTSILNKTGLGKTDCECPTKTEIYAIDTYNITIDNADTYEDNECVRLVDINVIKHVFEIERVIGDYELTNVGTPTDFIANDIPAEGFSNLQVIIHSAFDEKSSDLWGFAFKGVEFTSDQIFVIGTDTDESDSSGGTAYGLMRFAVKPNESTEPRSATLVFEQDDTGSVATITLNLLGKEAEPEYVFVLDGWNTTEYTLELPAVEAPGFIIPIRSTKDGKMLGYRAETEANFILLYPWSEEGLNGAAISMIDIAANDTNSDRTGTVVFTLDESNKVIKFTVKQKASSTPSTPDDYSQYVFDFYDVKETKPDGTVDGNLMNSDSQSFSVPKEGGTITVYLLSKKPDPTHTDGKYINCYYHIDDDIESDWITYDPNDAASSFIEGQYFIAKVECFMPENNTNALRECMTTFTQEDSAKTLTVHFVLQG